MATGYKLHEIDQMDLFHLFELLEEEHAKPAVFAEEVPWL